MLARNAAEQAEARRTIEFEDRVDNAVRVFSKPRKGSDGTPVGQHIMG